MYEVASIGRKKEVERKEGTTAKGRRVKGRRAKAMREKKRGRGMRATYWKMGERIGMT